MEELATEQSHVELGRSNKDHVRLEEAMGVLKPTKASEKE